MLVVARRWDHLRSALPDFALAADRLQQSARFKSVYPAAASCILIDMQ